MGSEMCIRDRKQSELQVGTEYAVVPSWSYGGSGARDIDRCRENDVVKAELVSKDKYLYEPSIRKDSADKFQLAPQGERSIGVMFRATDSNGNVDYWTARLADVVAPYAVLEPKWTAQKTAEAEKERAERERRAKVEEVQRRERSLAEVSGVSIRKTTRELLGEDTYVDVDTHGYNEDTKAVVTVSLKSYERLLELAYEGMGN